MNTGLLRVFICHASQDKPAIRELFRFLKSQDWIMPWQDEEKLLPGQDWDSEIYKAIREADVIIVCLSKQSVAKEGYVQKEFKRALSLAEEKPEGAIYIIPLRLDDCEPPIRFQRWQFLDYFANNAQQKLLQSLKSRAESLNLSVSQDVGKLSAGTISGTNNSTMEVSKETHNIPINLLNVELDLFRFILIPPTKELPHSYCFGKYPVTNGQYERFLNAPDFGENSFWVDFPKYDENCTPFGNWGNIGWDILKKYRPRLNPWIDDDTYNFSNFKDFGIVNPQNPVSNISWYEANAYCNWLKHHWKDLTENRANLSLTPKQIRLPLSVEWTVAAGGTQPKDRCPWDLTNKVTKDLREITKRANIRESEIGCTTPVNSYSQGASPHGVMDMAGNIWEWQANYCNKDYVKLTLRGGSWAFGNGRVVERIESYPDMRTLSFGFRVVVIPE